MRVAPPGSGGEPRIESAAVGPLFALRSAASETILLTNAFGDALCSEICAGASVGVAADRLAAQFDLAVPETRSAIDEILAGWNEAGLFEPERRDFIDPVAYRPARPEVSVAYASGAGAAVLHYEDARNHAQVDAVMSSLLPPVAPGDLPAGVVPDIFEVIRNDDGAFGLFRNGEPFWGAADFEVLRHFVLRELLTTLAGRDRVGATLHAGCVVRRGHAALIVGESGAGKTTLTIGLSGAGCQYLADDHVVLDRAGRQVISTPVRASAKTWSWSLDEVAPRLVGDPAETPRDGVRYAEMADPVAPWSWLPIGALIFPRFGADGPDEWAALDPGDSFLRLVEAGARIPRCTGTVAALAGLADRVPGFAVSFTGSDYSIPTCLDLIERCLKER